METLIILYFFDYRDADEDDVPTLQAFFGFKESCRRESSCSRCQKRWNFPVHRQTLASKHHLQVVLLVCLSELIAAVVAKQQSSEGPIRLGLRVRRMKYQPIARPRTLIDILSV